MLTLKKQCLRVALKFRYSRTKTNVVALQRSLNEFTCRALSTSSSDEKDTAPASFKDRWKMLIPALTTHICIGSSFAWSLYAEILSREKGIVCAAASDFTLMQAAMPMSIALAVFGVSASLLGNFQARVGPSTALKYSALATGGGFLLGSLGIHFHSLPLLYLGYGFFGGLGIGFAYTPPVQVLLQWFPDKKGFASGLTIAGFGSSAIFFTKAAQALMKQFSKFPEYLGPADKFTTRFIDGKIFADTVDRGLLEVVNPGPADLAKLSYDLAEGLYVVGTGSTGAAESLAIIGSAYSVTLFLSSFAIKKPHSSYVPDGYKFQASVSSSNHIRDFTASEALKTPQFYLLGTTFFCVATGGLGLFSVAKPLMSEVFSELLPSLVTSEFAMKYLLFLSACNLGGRVAWAMISDKIGRRNVFLAFTFGSIPLYLGLPTLINTVIETGSSGPMYAFVASTGLLISMVGGTYSILPAYESDLFGSKNVGAIHGKILLASAVGAISGPSLLLILRSNAEIAAIYDLISLMSPEQFQMAFGVSVENAKDLIAAKAITISKLMPHMTIGIQNPSPHLYDAIMYTLSGLMGVAAVAHSFVKPFQNYDSKTITIESKDKE